MHMGNYWNAVKSSNCEILSPAEAAKRWPEVVASMCEHHEVDSPEELEGKFSFCPYPNFDPGEAFSTEDYAWLAQNDPQRETDPGLTVTDAKSIFYYEEEHDELYDCGNDCMLWNC